MELSHSRRVVSAVSDEPNLVSASGLVPIMKLASRAGLPALADRFLTVPTDKGAHPGLKVSSLVAGMLAGADSIEDMAILRHGRTGRVFDAADPPKNAATETTLDMLEKTSRSTAPYSETSTRTTARPHSKIIILEGPLIEVKNARKLG